MPFHPVRPTQTWVGRTGALLAVASAGAHVAGMVGHHMAHVLIMSVMTLGCLYCAWHLWARATAGDWALVAVMNVAMIAAHQNMSMPASHSGHHLPVSIPQAASATPAMSAAITLAAVEVVFATVVLFDRTRAIPVEDLRRRPAFGGDQKSGERHMRATRRQVFAPTQQ